jgi:CHAD domain-containing protein
VSVKTPDGPAWQQALADIAADRIRRVRTAGTKGADFEAKVHEARTAVKLLRALWRLARPQVPERLYERENGRLRQAARRLRALRDLQVVQSTLAGMANADERDLARAAARFEHRLVRPAWMARQIRNGRAVLPGLLADMDRSLAAFRTAALDGEWVRAGLQRSFDRAYRGGRLDRDAPDERFHRWRKRAKALYLQLRALETLGLSGVTRLRKDLDRLQEDLGNDHDLVLLRQMLAARFEKGDQDVRVVDREAARRIRRLREDALKLGKKVLGRKAAHRSAAKITGMMGKPASRGKRSSSRRSRRIASSRSI